jgi:2-aminobenzoate-CoA ligase
MLDPAILDPSAHLDGFARANLPPRALWPEMEFSLPELAYPKRLNAAVELLDRMVERGFADRPCIRWPGGVWTYRELLDKANRIANVLVAEMGLVPGNRVLLRAANNPMHAACWFAVMKAGGIAVGTMPLLRARELSYIVEKAKVEFALCDKSLSPDLEAAREKAPTLRRIAYFHDNGAEGLEARMAAQAPGFANVATSHDDVALIAFTSGTTGPAKGTMHFHRDVLAICDAFPKYVLKPDADDIFVGSPPLAFTFGLGGVLLFPMRVGASTLLLEKTSAEILLQAIQDHRITICFTAPTMFRLMAELAPHYDLASLKKCVSAGETLPLPVFQAFHKATGIKIIDGLGSTEMLHVFLSNRPGDVAYGTSGRVVPGYRLKLLDEAGAEVQAGEIGELFVCGPSASVLYWGSRDKSRSTFQGEWTRTGDKYTQQPDGRYVYAGRSDDMLKVSGQYVSPFEVEGTLMQHPSVLECAVIAKQDADGLTKTKAFVVLKPGQQISDDALKAFVKDRLAPHKYPRFIEFIGELPKTATGKIQRFKLRERERA